MLHDAFVDQYLFLLRKRGSERGHLELLSQIGNTEADPERGFDPDVNWDRQRELRESKTVQAEPEDGDRLVFDTLRVRVERQH